MRSSVGVSPGDESLCRNCGRPLSQSAGGAWCDECGIRVPKAESQWVPGSALEQVAESAAVAVAGALGPVSSFLVSGGIAIRNNIAFAEWAAIVDRHLELSGRSLDPDDPVAIAIFNKLTIGAIQTSRTEKRELLAWALSNSGSASDLSDRVQERLADLAVRYDPEHLRVLALFGDPTVALTGIPGDTPLLDVLSAGIFNGAEDTDFAFSLVMQDLLRDNLVVSGFGSGSLVTDVRRAGDNLTTLGTRFLTYVRRNESTSL